MDLRNGGLALLFVPFQNYKFAFYLARLWVLRVNNVAVKQNLRVCGVHCCSLRCTPNSARTKTVKSAVVVSSLISYISLIGRCVPGFSREIHNPHPRGRAPACVVPSLCWTRSLHNDPDGRKSWGERRRRRRMKRWAKRALKVKEWHRWQWEGMRGFGEGTGRMKSWWVGV